jgi:hypothetical protein
LVSPNRTFFYNPTQKTIRAHAVFVWNEDARGERAVRKVASLRKIASFMIISAILLSMFVVLAPKTSAASQTDINNTIHKGLSGTLCVPNLGNLTVTVVDAATSNPIVGANVSIQGPNTEWNITGAGGNWTFFNITAGSYNVTASMVGYLPNSTWVCVHQGLTTNCTLSLEAVPVLNQGNLMVTVVDAATLSPIVGANVSIQGPETHWNITGAGGNWTFFNVTSGTYNVSASMTGFLSNTTSAIVFQGQTTNITLSLEAAVLHDVAVTDVVPDNDWVYQGKLCHAGVNVTVANLGEATENFTVSLYALNATAMPANVTIGTQQVTNLPPNGTLLLRFLWNSAGAQPSHLYNITAVASTVLGEINITNNVMSSPVLVKVRLLGDVNDDGSVNILDAILEAKAFDSSPGDPNWNLAADVNNDGIVNILDTILIGECFRIYVGSDP